jgi:hypothetical protein
VVALEIVIEFGLWGVNTKRLLGASWRAIIVDRETCERYSGSDDSPWLAIGWALHERARRRAGGHAMARNDGDLPWTASVP